MIILDTNVLSELMKADPNPRVIEWLDQQPVKAIWITTITAFETRYGLSLLKEGRRRQALETGYERFVHEILESRILPFNQPAADVAGKLAAQRRVQGIPVEFRDMLIAGIAVVQRATLATRNMKDFEAISPTLRLVNPWSV